MIMEQKFWVLCKEISDLGIFSMLHSLMLKASTIQYIKYIKRLLILVLPLAMITYRMIAGREEREVKRCN